MGQSCVQHQSSSATASRSSSSSSSSSSVAVAVSRSGVMHSFRANSAIDDDASASDDIVRAFGKLGTAAPFTASAARADSNGRPRRNASFTRPVLTAQTPLASATPLLASSTASNPLMAPSASNTFVTSAVDGCRGGNVSASGSSSQRTGRSEGGASSMGSSSISAAAGGEISNTTRPEGVGVETSMNSMGQSGGLLHSTSSTSDEPVIASVSDDRHNVREQQQMREHQQQQHNESQKSSSRRSGAPPAVRFAPDVVVVIEADEDELYLDDACGGGGNASPPHFEASDDDDDQALLGDEDDLIDGVTPFMSGIPMVPAPGDGSSDEVLPIASHASDDEGVRRCVHSTTSAADADEDDHEGPCGGEDDACFPLLTFMVLPPMAVVRMPPASQTTSTVGRGGVGGPLQPDGLGSAATSNLADSSDPQLLSTSTSSTANAQVSASGAVGVLLGGDSGVGTTGGGASGAAFVTSSHRLSSYNNIAGSVSVSGSSCSTVVVPLVASRRHRDSLARPRLSLF